ncbi:uncharacterized protein LTR77_005652 [Saxophila tyrrhenica]|uniref:C2H2-type domain-containing protein n=1 Tax=Saxophila tyrrhenica TaxID=1690608 RepID=A0AAV9PCK1_9PEZI|nr:hypothetical protein LTR77_005652 [Saxophila tyrrhenica]
MPFDAANYNSSDVEPDDPPPPPRLKKSAGQASIERYAAEAEHDRNTSKTTIRNLQFGGGGAPSTRDHEAFLLGKLTLSAGKPAPSASSMWAGCATIIRYGRWQWRDFSWDSHDTQRFRTFMDQLIADQRLMTGTWHEKTWIGFVTLSRLVRDYFQHWLDYGCNNFDLVVSDCLAIVLQAALGCRVGDVARTSGYSNQEAMRYEHVELYLVGDAPTMAGEVTLADLRATVEIAYAKGHKMQHNTSMFKHLQPLLESECHHVCPVTLLLIHALRHGLLDGGDTIQAVLDHASTTPGRRLTWKFPKRPVLVGKAADGWACDLDVPVATWRPLQTIKAMGLISGMLTRAYTHALRRGAGRDLRSLPDPAAGSLTAEDVRRSFGHSFTTAFHGHTDEYIGDTNFDLYSLRAHEKPVYPREPKFVAPGTIDVYHTVRARPTSSELAPHLYDDDTGQQRSRKAAVARLRQQRFGDIVASATPEPRSGHKRKADELPPELLPANTLGSSMPLAELSTNAPRTRKAGPLTDLPSVRDNADETTTNRQLLDEDSLDTTTVQQADLDRLATQIFLHGDGTPIDDNGTTVQDDQQDESARLLLGELLDDRQSSQRPDDSLVTFIDQYSRYNIICYTPFAKMWATGDTTAFDKGNSRDKPAPFMFRCTISQCRDEFLTKSELTHHAIHCNGEGRQKLKNDIAAAWSLRWSNMDVDERAARQCDHAECDYVDTDPGPTVYDGPTRLTGRLRSHLDRSHNSKFIPKTCPQCPSSTKVYQTRDSLAHHRRKDHSGRWPTACRVPDCRETELFSSAYRLDHHMLSVHQIQGDARLQYYPPKSAHVKSDQRRRLSGEQRSDSTDAHRPPTTAGGTPLGGQKTQSQRKRAWPTTITCWREGCSTKHTNRWRALRHFENVHKLQTQAAEAEVDAKVAELQGESERRARVARLRHRVDPSSTAQRLRFPQIRGRRDPERWASLLEGGLPPHLRDHTGPRADLTPNIEDVAEILLAAQEPVYADVDLLYYLAVEKERWDAVIWLVKRLVEAFGPEVLRDGRLHHVVGQWESESSLDALTEDKIAVEDAPGPEASLIPSAPGQATLDQLTGDKPDNLSRGERLAHNALGQIWRSLGHMVTACADTGIKAEILEIIAHLHHMGIMPASIYNQKPSTDSTSIQQPPTLNLLSSRILISLSDAAWRAHERSNNRTARLNSSPDDSSRPAKPGSRYKVNVAGLRPEVWLELILWACLHGGWIKEGAELLDASYTAGWKPFAWRSMVPEDNGSTPDWDKLEYAFNTRPPSAMDEPDVPIEAPVHRTISSEVINAYIDALASSTRQGVGERGLAASYVIERILTLQKLLRRGRLSLGAGSWDAVLLRLADLHGERIDHGVETFKSLSKLSPRMGAELSLPFGRDVPEYVFDGSAAIVGLHHRALRSRMHAGDVRGAFEVFRSLQEFADINKERSVWDFTKDRAPRNQDRAESETFTSNFPGIAYPAFEMQIPPTILGPFLDLVIDAGAYQFATWMVYSTEIDGPVIPAHLYTDPAVAPALIRFASETDDRSLLSKIVNARKALASYEHPSLPPDYLRAFFRSQVERKNWAAAGKILTHVHEMSAYGLDIGSIAHVTRAMLQEYGIARKDSERTVDQDPKTLNSEEVREDKTTYRKKKGHQDSEARREQTVAQNKQPFQDFSQARDLFTTAIQITYEQSQDFRDQVATLLIVLSRADNYWAGFCKALMPQQAYYRCYISTRAFNEMLKGIIGAFGAARGRSVIDAFWSGPIQEAQSGDMPAHDEDVGEVQMARFEPFLAEEAAIRNVVTLPTNPQSELVVYGGLQPDLTTIRLVLRSALDEIKDAQRQQRVRSNAPAQSSPMEGIEAHGQDSVQSQGLEASAALEPSALETIVWAARKLLSLGVKEPDVMEELEATLSKRDLSRLHDRLAETLRFDTRSEEHRALGELKAAERMDATSP